MADHLNPEDVHHQEPNVPVDTNRQPASPEPHQPDTQSHQDQ